MTNQRAVVVFLAVGTLSMWGCRGGCNTTDKGDQGANEKIQPDDYEGDDAGECSDGADNDRNGYFDCQDKGCWDSPDCDGSGNGGGDADTDVDADSDSDADSDVDTPNCVADICELDTVTIDYEILYDMGYNNGAFGLCSCTMEFSATGTIHEVSEAEGRATFDGTWELTTPEPPIDTACYGLEICNCPDVSYRCGNYILGGFWAPWDVGDTTAFHSFRWSPPENVADWVVHDSAFNYLPSNNPITDQQYWITQMNMPYVHADASPAIHKDLIETPPDLAIFGFTVYHTFDATFTK